MQEYLKQIEDKADKAIMYATKVLMTMPKLMAKIDSLEERIKILSEDTTTKFLVHDDAVNRLQTWVDNLDDKVEGLLEGVPRIVENINESLKEVQSVSEPNKPKRNQTDYGTYVKVKDLSDKGYLEKEIATELGIPYTTVRAYLRWTDAQIAKKKQQWEEKENKSPEPEMLQPYIVTQEQRQAYIDTHVPTPKFYPDKEEAKILSTNYSINDEYAQVEATFFKEEQIELPLVEADDEYEQVEVMLSSPASTVELTYFVDWTQEDRENNSFDNQYLPTGKDMIVIIRREDAYSMPYAVKELDWSAETNHPIDGWRLANEQEQSQYIQRCIGLL